MGRKSCFFIGHREATEEIYPTLYVAVKQHIVEYGVTEFIVGHYGGFDRLAALAVKEAKISHPDVKLTLLLPYQMCIRDRAYREKKAKPLLAQIVKVLRSLYLAYVELRGKFERLDVYKRQTRIRRSAILENLLLCITALSKIIWRLRII